MWFYIIVFELRLATSGECGRCFNPGVLNTYTERRGLLGSEVQGTILPGKDPGSDLKGEGPHSGRLDLNLAL